MATSSTPTEYFQTTVLEQFAAKIENAPSGAVDQPVLTATYVITGEGGGTFGLRAHGKAIEFVPDGIVGSDMQTTMTVENWRRAVEDGETNPFVDNYCRGKAEVVKSLKGAVALDLTRADGSTYEDRTIFNGEEEPEVTLRMTADDYAAMMRGDLNGQMAFMTGKLKFEGSLPLLMQIGALSG